MPTSPYVVNVSSLLQKPGSMRELELDITAPERIGEGLIHFAELFGLQADEALVYIVENEAVDLEGPLRDTVVLDLPFQPLCEPDCLGLDPATGEKLTEPLPEPEDEIDPRWAQLQQLLDDKQ